MLYGKPVENVLSHAVTLLAVLRDRDLTELNFEEPSLKLKVGGYISSVNYQAKKLTMLLFINHRLVESSGKHLKFCERIQPLLETILADVLVLACREEVS